MVEFLQILFIVFVVGLILATIIMAGIIQFDRDMFKYYETQIKSLLNSIQSHIKIEENSNAIIEIKDEKIKLLEARIKHNETLNHINDLLIEALKEDVRQAKRGNYRWDI